MGVQKERKSTFLTAFEHREKEARSLFAAQLISHFGYASTKKYLTFTNVSAALSQSDELFFKFFIS